MRFEYLLIFFSFTNIRGFNFDVTCYRGIELINDMQDIDRGSVVITIGIDKARHIESVIVLQCLEALGGT